MAASFRAMLDDLRAAGELVEVKRPVDIRHIATLVDQAKTALLFRNVVGYQIPVLSGLTNSRQRIAIAMGCAYGETEARLRRGLDHPDRKSTRLNSSHSQISYAVFCLKKKKKNI